MRRSSAKTTEDLVAQYGQELWDRAVFVKNTDRDNLHPKWNTETLCVLFIAFSKSPQLAYVARAAGVPAHIINAWRRKNPSFDDFVNAARDDGISVIEDALFKAAERGNVNAQIAVLRAYKPELYGQQSRMTLQTQTSSPYDLSKLTSEEIATLERISDKALIAGERVPNENNPLVQRALAAKAELDEEMKRES